MIKKQNDKGAELANEIQSLSMNQFKDSIINSQIKRQTDPNKWVKTGQLVCSNSKLQKPVKFKH